MDSFSDFVVYVDESGDHGLVTIDPSYPLFVLVFCIFKKVDYIESAIPLIQKFKFKHFGHDQVILHETDIRKDKGDFSFLKSRATKDNFLNELTSIVEEVPFVLVSTVIKKGFLSERYKKPENPYHIALRYGLERIHHYLTKQKATGLTHIVVEKRGKAEDDELELEFRRVCGGYNALNGTLPFDLVFADKKTNSTGLQVADLLARPIGLKILRPEQSNRAFEIIEKKFYCDGRGEKDGYGLKCFP